jgi:hypothetical protein
MFFQIFNFFRTLLVLVTSHVTFCSTYSGGAPASQCMYMTPKHGFQPQVSPSPFRLLVDKTEMEPGEVAGAGSTIGSDCNLQQDQGQMF